MVPFSCPGNKDGREDLGLEEKKAILATSNGIDSVWTE